MFLLKKLNSELLCIVICIISDDTILMNSNIQVILKGNSNLKLQLHVLCIK